MSYEESLIGRGMAFPVRSTPAGSTEITAGLERINHSIFIILSTEIGTKLFNPDFGSRLQSLRFDPIDSRLIQLAETYVREDIQRWEPRIIVEKVVFLDDPDMVDNNALYIRIHYGLINTNVSSNYVFPFKTEPRNIPESGDYNVRG